ncbi:hypothetical protein JCM6882_003285 [Rhodosporidiobolus microsporus]
MGDSPLSTSAPSSPRMTSQAATDALLREERRRSSIDAGERIRPSMVIRTNGSSGMPHEEEESFQDWVERYRVGQAGPSDAIPLPPASILAILEGHDNSQTQSNGDAHSPAASPPTSAGPSSPQVAARDGSSHSSSDSHTSLPSLQSLTAATLLDFYRRKGHFPAPPGPFEEERLRLAHKYALDQPVRRKAIDRICGLAKKYFQTKSVVISLTFDDYQVLGAERGWGGEEPGFDVPPRPLTMPNAFCSHAMLQSYRDPKSVFIVADADKDWRFKSNPYTVGNGGGLAFYAAANVNLPVPEDKRKTADLPPTLASGALCLIDGVPRAAEAFTQEDREVLTDLAAMISREFQHGFEQRRREQEAAQSDFVGSFLHQALVMPPQPGDLQQEVSEGESPPNTPPAAAHPLDETSRLTSSPSKIRPPKTARPTSKRGRETASAEEKETLFALAARQLRVLTHAGSAAIIDCRTFKTASAELIAPSSPATASRAHARSTSSGTPPSAATPSLAAALGAASPFEASTATPLHTPPPRRESLNSQFWRSSGPSSSGRGRVSLGGSHGDVQWEKVFRRRRRNGQGEQVKEEDESAGSVTDETDSEEQETVRGPRRLEQAVQDTLRAYYDDPPASPEACKLDASRFVSYGLIPASKATASICVPIFDVDGAPAVLIVLTSGEKWFDFEPSDRRFASSVGAIIVGSLLRQRAIEADRAKLAFVSQVSHELRTPCHGVNSQIELIREFSSPDELRRIAPLLDAADVCLESLRDVLDDTLDFSKLTNVSPAEAAELARRAAVPADLESLVEGITKSTWIKRQRSALVEKDVMNPVEETSRVSLVLEVEERKGGWGVLVDVGGLKRVLLNLVGNSCKFTKEGEVKLSLRDGGPLLSATGARQSRNRRIVVITVKDDGIGMKPEFLRDGSHLLPFVQADPFAPGAGLGLSICDNIIKRLGGKLECWSQVGVGTTMTVTLPLEFTPSADLQPANGDSRPSYPRTKRRVISEELARLLRPSSPPSSAARPNFERSSSFVSTLSSNASVDFPTAVEVTQAALFPSSPHVHSGPALPPTSRTPLQPRSPSAASHSNRILGAAAEHEDLVIEAAKLSLSSAPQVASTVLPVAEVPSPSKVEKASPTSRRVKVLACEDNPIARNILVKLFTGKGIDFVAAEDGQAGVEAFEKGGGDFTIAFMDVQMPRLDGIEASTEIRRLETANGWNPMRIIALTGLSNESDMQAAMGKEGPVDSWLVKGGKSLAVIMSEITAQQQEFDSIA